MQILTRAQAIAQNIPRYFTGKPCKYGHVGERSTRAKTCVTCQKLYQKTCKQRYKEQRRVASRERRRKMRGTEAGRLHYNALQRLSNQRKKGLPTPTRGMPEFCECCGKPPRGNSKNVLHLDHDHITGVFRGWLCGPCNVAIGTLGDTSDGIMRALEYLVKAGS